MGLRQGSLFLIFYLFVALSPDLGHSLPVETSDVFKMLCNETIIIPGQFFRLDTTEDRCGHYYTCNAERTVVSVNRCPNGFQFDLNLQLCQWPGFVSNCGNLLKNTSSVYPSKVSTCDKESERACGNGFCLPKHQFCDGVENCNDNADEALCGVGNDPNGAEICGSGPCQLPYCYCSARSTLLPLGNATNEHLPQLIALTFDGSVGQDEYQAVNNLFQEMKKGLGIRCEFAGTFFVWNGGTNFSLIHDLYAQGHEIGVNYQTGFW